MELIAKTEKLARLYPEKRHQVREINIAAARKGINSYRSAVHRGALVRVRRKGPTSPRYEGGKKGPSQDIKPGTLWRSIKVIKPANGTNVWLGPRSLTIFQKKGLTQINNSDAWFAHIVDAGRERFGPGRNRGFGQRGMAAAARRILPFLRNSHAAFIQKHWK